MLHYTNAQNPSLYRGVGDFDRTPARQTRSNEHDATNGGGGHEEEGETFERYRCPSPSRPKLVYVAAGLLIRFAFSPVTGTCSRQGVVSNG